VHWYDNRKAALSIRFDDSHHTHLSKAIPILREYGNRVASFRRMLEQHIERRLWCRIHYHSIGKGLSSSEANLRAALDIAKKYEEDLWIAGMAEIYKYQTERSYSMGCTFPPPAVSTSMYSLSASTVV